jgi:hypothetical protein
MSVAMNTRSKAPSPRSISRRQFGMMGMFGAMGGLSALAGCQPSDEASVSSALSSGSNAVGGELPGTLEQECRTSTTVLTNSTSIASFPLAPSTTYLISAVLNGWSYGNGGFKMRFYTNGYVGLTAGGHGVSMMGVALISSPEIGPDAPLNPVAFTETSGVTSWKLTPTQSVCLRVDGLLTTAATFPAYNGHNDAMLTFQWAQQQSDPTATTLSFNSWISVVAL